MSKMVAPEMDVVRFRESDVIVASSMMVKNFNNSTDSDGSITYKGTVYSIANGNHNDIKNVLGGRTGIQSTVREGWTDYNKTIPDLFEADFNSEDRSFGYVTAVDGTYYWSESSNMWMHQ